MSDNKKLLELIKELRAEVSDLNQRVTTLEKSRSRSRKSNNNIIEYSGIDFYTKRNKFYIVFVSKSSDSSGKSIHITTSDEFNKIKKQIENNDYNITFPSDTVLVPVTKYKGRWSEDGV